MMNIERGALPIGGLTQPMIIEMKAVTWCKDSHGLFDYESKSLEIKKFRVDSPALILRDKEDISIVQNQNKLTENAKLRLLLAITSSGEDKYFINPCEQFTQTDDESTSSLNNSPQNGPQTPPKPHNVYLIVRSLKNKEGLQRGYALEPGHIVKLGRMEFKVLEIRHPGDMGPRSIETTKKFENASYTGETQTCRICLEEMDPNHQHIDEQMQQQYMDHDRTMIAPCRCKGSCQYLHVDCFRNWFGSKVISKTIGNTVTYHWKTCECEVCQDPIPRNFSVDGNTYSLFDWSQVTKGTSDPYIVLECITREKKTPKIIHVCRLPKETPVVNIGRGHQCDVRVGDISVSRLHAFIKYENGQFLLTDNNSKFGTLIMLNEPFPICEEKVAVQVGRTVITFVTRRRNDASAMHHSGVRNSHKIFPNLGELTGQQHQQDGSKLDISAIAEDDFIPPHAHTLIPHHMNAVAVSNISEREQNPNEMIIEEEAFKEPQQPALNSFYINPTSTAIPGLWNHLIRQAPGPSPQQQMGGYPPLLTFQQPQHMLATPPQQQMASPMHLGGQQQVPLVSTFQYNSNNSPGNQHQPVVDTFTVSSNNYYRFGANVPRLPTNNMPSTNVVNGGKGTQAMNYMGGSPNQPHNSNNNSNQKRF